MRRPWIETTRRDAERTARIASRRERQAARAEANALEFRLFEYLRSQPHERARPGEICGVAEYGVFASLDGFFVEAFLPVEELTPPDRYHYDARRQQLRGVHTSHVFKAGDRVGIRLLGVDLARRRLDLRLAWHDGA